MSYTNWDGGEPNHGGNGDTSTEDCAVLRHWNGKWNDINCDAEKEFLCSKAKTEDTSNEDRDGCPAGFSKFMHSDGSEHCWLFEENTKSYDQARSDCIGKADGTELASILEVQEGYFSYSLQKGIDAWIGLQWNQVFS